MSRLAWLALLLTACGGDPFVAGTLDAITAGDAGDLGDALAPPEAAAPTPEAGSSVDAGGDAQPRDAGPRSDASEPTPDAALPPPDRDASSPPEAAAPPDAGAVDAAGPTDPIAAYGCGTHANDGTVLPIAAQLQWWASVSVQQPDGGVGEDYCAVMSTGDARTFAYTCEGIASVWSCAQWQSVGGTLGCHPDPINPSIVQVDCWIP